MVGGSKISLVLLGFVFVGFSDISASNAASFQGLGHLPGGSCSEATAVSGDGSVVVGTSCTPSGVQAFRWTATDGIVGIPIPAGLIKSWATDVSADGNFVVGYGRKSDSPPYGYEGFRWHVSGGMDRITDGGINVLAHAISGDGSIVVGTSWATGIEEQAFRWTAAGGLGRLDGLHNGEVRSSVEAISADGLVVVGHRIYDGYPYRDCFWWTEGEVVGFDAHTANATSNDGSVVVGGLDNHQTQLFEAYRWTRQAGISLLQTCLPNFHSRALGVSGDGSIVVGYVQNNAGFDEQKAFIWDEEHGMRLLQDVLENDFGLDLSGWRLSEPWTSWKATGISEDGLTIVGVAMNSQGEQEAWRAVLCKVVYVDKDAPGANNGSSWENAYNSLQDALADGNSSTKPVEIRVAEGIYKPDRGIGITPGDRSATFQLINGVTLKGGYAGFAEPNCDVRDVNAYETVLSGDLADNDVAVSDAAELLDEPSRQDNSYHVVTGSGTDDTAVLDGFTVTAGNSKREYWVAYYGGGVEVQSGSPSLVNCRLHCNIAAQGGGLHIGSGGVQLVGCTFSNNAAIHAGGMLNGGRQTTLTDCAFIGNYADTSGGATICTDAMFTRCSFVRNRARVSTGGAVNNDCSAPKFEQCTFVENAAPYAGGALYNYEGDLVITYCKFIGNSSERGGGIFQGDTDTILTGCEFVSNEAVTGGGISNQGYSDPTLTDCTFTDNSAEYGGGFYNTTGSAPILINCMFSGNRATESGGAIGTYNNYGYGLVLADCLFSENTARNGGAIYNDQGNPTLTNCTFSRNSAGYEGGGLYNLTGSPLLTGCVFAGNRSAGDGGGMQNDDGSPSLTNCTFIRNFADDEGGGLCNEDTHAPPLGPILTNCIFIGNSADDGGGMCNDESSPTLANCTFSGNSADRGGAIYNEHGGRAMLTNCILWADSPGEIYDNAATAVATYSDVQGGWPGQGNIDLDPCFADPNNGNYHLKSQAGRWDPNSQTWLADANTSPCVDAGDPNSDWSRELWPHGKRINMGAYGGTAEASMSLSSLGNVADLNNNNIVNLTDFGSFADEWLLEEILLPEDLNRNGKVDLADLKIFAQHWLEGTAP